MPKTTTRSSDADPKLETQSERSDRRRAARVCGAWLFGGSILVSLSLSLQSGEVLPRFHVEAGVLGSVVALSLVRVLASHLAAMAVWLGVCSYARDRARVPYGVLFVVPVLYPVPIVLGLPLSAVVMQHKGVASVAEFWSGLLRWLTPRDFIVGLSIAFADSLCLAGLALIFLPFLDARVPRGIPRALLSWLAGGCAIELVAHLSKWVLAIV
jgi:hypothetical protein